MNILRKKKLRRTLAVALTFVVAGVTLLPDDIRYSADDEIPIEATTEVSSEFTLSEEALNEETEEPETTEVIQDTTEVLSEETTQESTTEALTEETTEDLTTEEVTEEATEESTEESTEPEFVVFDHIYNDGISLNMDFSSCELLVSANPEVFTKNTAVISEYSGIYLLRFNSAEETKSAYSYYYDKVQSIEVNKTSFTISTLDTEIPENSEVNPENPAEDVPPAEPTATTEADIADLSSLNSGNDAFAEASDLPDVSMSGYIALIDTGCSGADKSVSVLGGSTGDDHGHGTKMLNAIKKEYPGARVLSIKAVSASGTAQVSDIYAAIMYAIDSNVSIINLSVASGRSPLVESAISQAIAHGITIVGAAGNQSSDAAGYVPGGISSAVVAGACDESGKKLDISNYGATVDYNIVADSTSEAAAILSAMIARDGLDNLPINEGKIFETDYTPDETPEEEITSEEATTEEAVEIPEETTTQEVTTETATKEDATASDSTNSKWKIKDLIDGLFSVQSTKNNGDEYNLGGLVLYCDNTDKPCIGRTSQINGRNVYLYCGQHDAASPFSYNNTYINGYEYYQYQTNLDQFTPGSEGRNIRCAFWDQFRGKNPNIRLSNDDANSFSQNKLTTRSKYGSTHLPDSNNFKICKLDGTTVLSNANGCVQQTTIKVNRVGDVYRTEEFKVFTETSDYDDCIQARIEFTNAKIYYKNRNSSDFKGGQTVGGDMRVNDSETIYFEFEAGQTPQIKFSAVQKGTNDTAYYIGPAYKLNPLKQIHGDSGYRYLQPLLCVTETSVSLQMDLEANDAPFPISVTKQTEPTQMACVSGNPNYSLNGAEYTVYTDGACTTPATDINGNPAVIKISANPGETTSTATAVTMIYPLGTSQVNYFLKETKAPDKGYEVSQEVKMITITQAEAITGETKSVTFNEHAILDPMVLSLSKIDADLGDKTSGVSSVNGGGDLGDAYFTMNFYAVDISNGQTYTKDQLKNPDKTWIFKTIKDPNDNVYRLSYDNAHKVSGPELYYNLSGTTQLPMGYITIQETKAPRGYTTENAVFDVIYQDGTRGTDDNGVIVAKADANGRITVGNKATDLNIIQSEQPVRSDLYIKKVDEDGKAVAGAKFKVTNTTTGEVHYFYTDANGVYDSSKVSKLTNTNAMDTSGKYEEAGLWFGYDNQGVYHEPTSETAGALNCGSYEITEERNDSVDGLHITPVMEVVVNTGSPAKIPLCEKELKTDVVTEMKLPEIKTVAVSGSTGDKNIKVSTDETIKDEVSFTNLKAATDFILHGSLWILHKDGTYEEMNKADGTQYTVDLPFTTRKVAAGDKSIFCVTDKQTTVFEHVDTTVLADGDKIVVYEELSLASGQNHYDIKNYGEENFFPIIENDINNKDQTLSVPSIQTNATEAETSSQIVEGKEIQTVNDAVDLTGLVKGDTYEVRGTLHKWGLANGKTFTENTATSSDGYEQNIDMYTKEELEAAGYEDLGELLDKDGNPITGFTEFTAEEEAETRVVSFTYDSSLLAGETIVVYEDLYHNGVIITSHRSITAESQSIHYPRLQTSIHNNATLTREVLADGMADVTDVVACKNFLPGVYTVFGILVDRQTGVPIRDADGNLVTGHSPLIIPEDATGTDTVENGEKTRRVDTTVSVDYNFNASNMSGRTVVAYEWAVTGTIPDTLPDSWEQIATGTDVPLNIIARHMELSDASQTLYFPGIVTKASGDIENYAYADGEVVVKDVAGYTNLRPNSDYNMTATIHVQHVNEDGEVVDLGTLKDSEGRTITKTVQFKTGKVNNGIGGVDGEVEVEITVDGSLLAGKTVVYMEAITRDSLLVAMHMDIESEDQAIHFPSLGTSLTDKQSENRISYAGKTVTLLDTVHYENAIPGKEVELYGTLHVKNGDYKAATATDATPGDIERMTGADMTEDTILYVDGKPVTNSVKFIPETPSGDVDISFTFDATGLGGYTLVAAEKMYYKGVLIGVHTDMQSKPQTSNVPRIHTLAVNNLTASHMVNADGIADITDYVYYENLKEGETYRSYGTVMNQDTGEPVKDKNGDVVKGYTEFTVHGTDDLFTNTTYLDTGKTNLGYYTQAGADATITDATDTDALVASASGGKEEVRARRYMSEDAIIAYFTDGTSVSIPRRQYVVVTEQTVGVDAQTETVKSEIVDSNTESTTNKTGGIDGIVKVNFAFDASGMDGLNTVVFEELYIVKDGKESLVADHKSLTDEDQSLIFPQVHTTFLDKASNSHQIAKGQEEVTLVDTVEWSGLIPGHTYSCTGSVRVSGDKSGKYKDGDILRYADGSYVTKTVTFVAQAESGSTDVVFTVPADIIPKAKKLTAFESLEENGAQIAIHMDLDDEGQSVTPPPDTPHGPPKTGVIILIVLIAVLLISGVGAIITFSRKKK